MSNYRKVLSIMILVLGFSSFVHVTAQAVQTETYTVQPGDSLWKIAVRYEVGLSEIISANPQFKDPHWIYPGNMVTIPLLDEIKREENQVIDLVNTERAKVGLPSLKANWEVSRVARYKSADMRDQGYFQHDSPVYGSPFTMLRSFGVSFESAGENIAAGQRTPQEVVQSWMNSPGHRQNILHPQFTQIGVGLAKGGKYGFYWTQMFIRE
jgi:uncharacterized YkwD family protein/spore coat assembly protein SafA